MLMYVCARLTAAVETVKAAFAGLATEPAAAQCCQTAQSQLQLLQSILLGV